MNMRREKGKMNDDLKVLVATAIYVGPPTAHPRLMNFYFYLFDLQIELLFSTDNSLFF